MVKPANHKFTVTVTVSSDWSMVHEEEEDSYMLRPVDQTDHMQQGIIVRAQYRCLVCENRPQANRLGGHDDCHNDCQFQLSFLYKRRICMHCQRNDSICVYHNVM